MKRTTRLIALILALLLLLQCTAAATEAAPGSTATAAPADLSDSPAPEAQAEPPADAESTPPEEEVPTDSPEEPAPPAQEEDAPAPEDPAPEEIRLSVNLEDGLLVHKPTQLLCVEALQGETLLGAEAIRVTCGGKVVEAQEEGYPLNLAQGDNLIEITAQGEGESSKALSLTVRYEIFIPEGWAHDALSFCVQQGILNGNQHGELLPTNSAARAQLAAMLVRLFAATPEADLSGYTDMAENAWYYKEMSQAVAMGIFEGSGGKLNPEKPITREQAFTVLARAFGVAAASPEALDAFDDGNQVSIWAESSVAGMLEAGYIHGSGNGKLNPKGNITRQELAQVLYNALDCITDDPEALSGRNNLYTGSLEALSGKTIPGNLILSCGSGEEAVLENFTVEGRLALHLHNAKEATVAVVSDSISLCSPTVITLQAPVETLLGLRDDAGVHGDANTVILLGSTLLWGHYGTVICNGGDSTIAGVSQVDKLELNESMAGGTISLYGKATEVYAYARRLHIAENGSIETLYQYRNDLDVSCAVKKLEDRVDAGLEGVSLLQTEIPAAYYDKLELTLSGTITGVNSTQVYGVPDGVRMCTATYTYNGKVIKTDPEFPLKDGAQLSCSLTAALQYNVDSLQEVIVTLRYGDEILNCKLQLQATGRYSDYHTAKNSVKTIHVIATVNYSTSLYSYSSLSGYVGSVPAGTQVYFLKYGNESGSVALIETKSGMRAWISGYAIRISWQNYHNNAVSYSDGVKEAFVNEVHNYSSPTKYLIWCNLYTTTVNIFEGSQGNWKLIKSCECVIGAPNSPTRPGVFSLYSRAYYWSFDEGARLDQSRCYYASLFDGGIAFHTRLYYTGTNTMVNSSLSAAISHGCVRCPDDIAKFIYTQCPLGTTVVVY